MPPSMRKIRWGIGALAVVVAGALAFTVFGGSPDSSDAGGCGSIERVAKGAQYRALDCGSDQANVRVAKVVDEASQCPEGGAPYTAFTRSSTLCLIPNFVEGACYHGDRGTGIRKVDCTAEKAIRVVRAGPEQGDCADGQTLTYPEPVVTFCLAPADAVR